MKRILALFVATIMVFALPSPVLAADAAVTPGVVVSPCDESPTGFVVTFTLHHAEATLVELAGEFMLRDFSDPADTTTFLPHEFRPGLFSGAVNYPANQNFFQEMEYLGDGYWTLTIPLPGGTRRFWLHVYTMENPDVSMREESQNVFMPMMPTPINLVRVPWHEVQGYPEFNRDIEHPRTDGRTGTVITVDYYADRGANDWGEQTLSVYLPYGFDPYRPQPYPVIFMSHGAGGNAGMWFAGVSAQHIMDNLIADENFPPTVLVAMNHMPLGGFEPNFHGPFPNQVENLIYNVMPFAEENFNVSTDPNFRAHIAFSQGSALSTHLLYEHPTTFGYLGMFGGGGDVPERDWTSVEGLDFPTIVYGYGVFATGRQRELYEYFPYTMNTHGIELSPNSPYRLPSGHDPQTWAQMFVRFTRNYLWEGLEQAEVVSLPDYVERRYVDGVAFVPIRAWAENRGATVEWDGDTQTVTITSAYGNTWSFEVGYQNSFLDAETWRVFVTYEYATGVFAQ